MSDEDIETLNSLNETADDTQTDGQVSDTDINDNAQTDAAHADEEAGKLRELNKKLFERAKKAEAEVKTLKSKPIATVAVSEPEQVQLTPMDAIILSKADISEKEDIEAIVEYANYKHITVAAAMKTSVMKAELAQRKEERKTARATNTGGSR